MYTHQNYVHTYYTFDQSVNECICTVMPDSVNYKEPKINHTSHVATVQEN